MTVIQNARTSGGGNIPCVPNQAATVGPVETWRAEKVSIWHPGWHDNPFGMRLTALMIAKRLARRGRAHVAPGRPSQRAIQLPPAGDRHVAAEMH